MKPPEKPFDFQDSAESSGAPLGQTGKTVYSVSELTSKIKALLEDRFPIVWICGEVSNFRMPASGHCYFTLKDDAAQISAVLFRGQYRQPRFIPEDGMSVIGLGRLSVYEPRGNYQIILEYVEPAGLGALQLAFEKLKKRFAAEGISIRSAKSRYRSYLPKSVSSHRRDGVHVAIVGDVLHSRVARSLIEALGLVRARTTLIGPPTLIPRGIEAMGCTVRAEVGAAADADVVYVLRMSTSACFLAPPHGARTRSRTATSSFTV